MKKIWIEEQKIFIKIKEILISFEEDFSEKKITYEVKLKQEDIKSYFSEVEIIFNRDGKFIDILEFFIIRDNELYFDTEKGFIELYSDLKEIIQDK